MPPKRVFPLAAAKQRGADRESLGKSQRGAHAEIDPKTISADAGAFEPGEQGRMELANQIIGLLMVAVPLIAGAAAIVARSRGARLMRNMVLLAFAPAILMAAVLGIGALFSPAHDSPFSQFAFAVMLIGIFAVIPWALVCAIGFAIGYRIRRKHPPSETEPVRPRASAAAARTTDAPAPAPRLHPFAAWRTALVILVATIAAIAGLTYMSMKTGIDPPRLLTGVPHIPRFPH